VGAKLVRTRDCNGSCCRSSPQFANDDKTDCIYHIGNGCELMRTPTLQKKLSEFELNKFNIACNEWPHNMPNRETGDCCWQWVES